MLAGRSFSLHENFAGLSKNYLSSVQVTAIPKVYLAQVIINEEYRTQQVDSKPVHHLLVRTKYHMILYTRVTKS